MFTGIIQSIGNIVAVDSKGGDARLRIAVGALDLADAKPGDSIAVNGVCLTAVELTDREFTADVSGETLARTTLKFLKTGSNVNLELALTPLSRLGGHLVSGHVDGLARLVERRADARSQRLCFEVPAALAKYIAEKGSVCIDGVSLTVNAVNGARFDVNIVPHTLANTTLDSLRQGDEANLEVDLIARYLERLLLGDKAAGEGSVTRDFLARHGFIG